MFRIGADHVIDYNRADFADGQRHYDLILDIGGNSRPGRDTLAIRRLYGGHARGKIVITV